MSVLWLFLAAVAWVSAPAMADPNVLSFSYTNLAGSYSPTTGQYTAVATASLPSRPNLFSSGTVSRLVDPTSAASFWWSTTPYGPQFPVGSWGSAAFVLSLSVSNVTANTAVGVGTLTATDIDGDTITAHVAGTWALVGAHAAFDGTVSDVVFSPSEGQSGYDGFFNGQLGTQFLSDFSDIGPMIGLVQDTSELSGGFFEGAYSGKFAEVQASLIPAPGAVLLGMLGFGLIGWFKRRFA